ncbi:MAG TPA: hypothetical protein VFN10_15025 [Thermoanaerobaculia bacterium]|nr:hypothetical protein [Thermoanaerobaculia bacterium]
MNVPIATFIERAARETLPAYEEALDIMAELLFEADGLLELIRSERGAQVRWIEPQIQLVFDTVNSVMKAIAD